MIWREIKLSGEIDQYLTEIWQVEQAMPQWFRDSKSWIASEDAYRRFTENCHEIYGLFDGDRLLAVIYFESYGDTRELELHLSVVEHISPTLLIGQCRILRDRLFHGGVRVIRGWILGRNYGLARIVAGVGFKATGLEMENGTSRGRPLRWLQGEIVRS